MALKEQDIVLTTKDASGNTVIQMPITRAGNVEDLTNTCLPLAGGTMTGNIIGNRTEFTILQKSDANSTIIRGGTAYASGASLVLFGKDNENAGITRLIAHDGTNINNFLLYPNGTATIGGQNLVRSVNLTGADENGNVALEFPVTSVNGKTGDVTLRFAPSGSPITTSATPGNNVEWTYTTTTDGYLALSAKAGTGRKSTYVVPDEGAVGDYVYTAQGSTSLVVTVGSETLCNKSSSAASTSFSVTNKMVAKGTVIKVKCYRSYSSNAIAHSVSLTIDPYALT